MSPTHFQDDLAEWDLCTGCELSNFMIFITLILVSNKLISYLTISTKVYRIGFIVKDKI
jgi:hypothetical protein